MESKLAHLLQPIRDLAANWDVNVAEELEDYLVRLLDQLKRARINYAAAGVLNTRTNQPSCRRNSKTSTSPWSRTAVSLASTLQKVDALGSQC